MKNKIIKLVLFLVPLFYATHSSAQSSSIKIEVDNSSESLLVLELCKANLSALLSIDLEKTNRLGSNSARDSTDQFLKFRTRSGGLLPTVTLNYRNEGYFLVSILKGKGNDSEVNDIVSNIWKVLKRHYAEESISVSSTLGPIAS